jgi:hypothetical protein
MPVDDRTTKINYATGTTVQPRAPKLTAAVRTRGRPRVPVRPANARQFAAGLLIRRLVAFSRRYWEVAAYGVLAFEFVWTRLIDMQISFWDDEAHAVVQYIDPGLAGVYSTAHYTPNNHLLFDLLSWITVSVLGHNEATYRLWSVVPAILAAAALVWWTRRRLGRVAGLIAAGILLTSPLLLQWTIQARGYGLAQLGITLVVLGACEIEEHGPGRWPLAFLALGAFVTPATHTTALVPVGLTLAWLMRRRDLRRPVLKASLIAGVALWLVTTPILPTMIRVDATYRKYGKPIPLAGPITGPMNLGAYNGELMLTGTATRSCNTMCFSSGQLAEWGGPLFLAALAAIVELWGLRRRGILGALLIPLAGSFALFAVGSVWAADRFVLVLFPAYTMLAAVGAASIVHALDRGVVLRGALAVAGALLLGQGALRIYHFNQRFEPPSQDYKAVGVAYRASGVPVIFSDGRPSDSFGLQWYIGRRLVYLSPAALQDQLCNRTGALAFIQHYRPITPTEAACLARRHAAVEDFRGGVLRLWLVQSPGLPSVSAKAIRPTL